MSRPLLVLARAALALMLVLALPCVAAPAVALFYGAEPPLDELQAFDIVVLEPDQIGDPGRLPRRHTRWFAYISVGEVQPSRPYFRDLPSDWLRGENTDWGSRLIDQTAPGWAQFVEQRVVGPLWQQGYRGFFVDTLDSFHRFATTDAQRRAQRDALVALVERLHERFPGIELIFNRGFEILPRLRGKVAMVAAESLFLRYDATNRTYGEVPAADREWLLAQLRQVQREHDVPILSIDYAPPADRERARAAAQRIRALGFIPWVSNGALDTLGVGNVEVMPRRIALVTDVHAGVDLQQTPAVQFAALPLHYLGYTLDIYDVQRDRLPERLADGRTAAIVTWFSQPVATLNPRFGEWLRRMLDEGMRLVMLNAPGIDFDSAVAARLGLRVMPQPQGQLQVAARDPIVGFEQAPSLVGRDVLPVRVEPATALLSFAAPGGRIDAVALTPWGGMALAPYAISNPTLDIGPRWVIDPIEFLRRALGAPSAPVPDVTTEGGRRLLLIHIDGDGFPSRAEIPGTPLAGEALRREILERYRVPHTMSIIQGEIAANGMFPQLAPELEGIARRIFALPHVELASHSYSHPFYWRAISAGAALARDSGYGRKLNLDLPDYRFDLATEIAGSARYIDERLAPPHKRTRVFLWTGDTVPTAAAVQAADAAGLLNMNGGDTTATRSEPTLTLMAGLGLRRGAGLQVFAPNQNENVYTNNWLGPYYGFQRVIETFELTETPRRLKPINIYYHTYSASKRASLTALQRVYGWAMAQPHVAVYASDYIRKVHDFHHLVIARDWTQSAPRWRVRGGGELRTLRLPADQQVDLGASVNVAGARPAPEGSYLHLAGSAAEVQIGSGMTATPQVYEARGWITDLVRRPGTLSFTLNSYSETGFTLADARHCQVRVDDRPVASTPAPGALLRHDLPARPVGPAPTLSRVDVACRR